MISNDLLKRTPVRLAGAFAILFALTVIALVAVLYFTLVSELEGDIRQRVEEMSDTLGAIDAQQGFDGLAAVVAERGASRSATSTASSCCVADDGSFRAGNVQNVRVFTGWGELDRAWLPMVADKGGRRRPLLRHVDAGVQGAPPRRRQRPRDARGAAHPAARRWAGACSRRSCSPRGSAIFLARRAQRRSTYSPRRSSKVSRGDIARARADHGIARRPRSRRRADQRHAGPPAEAHRERQSGVVRHRPRSEETASGGCAGGWSWRCAAPASVEDIPHAGRGVAGRARFHRRDVRGAAAHHADRGRRAPRALQSTSSSAPCWPTSPTSTSRSPRRRAIGSWAAVAIAERAQRHGRPRAADAALRQSDRERHPPLPQGTRIDVSLATRGERHVAVVADSGPGIPAARVRKRISPPLPAGARTHRAPAAAWV